VVRVIQVLRENTPEMANTPPISPTMAPSEPEHEPDDEVFDVEHPEHLGAERTEAELNRLLDRFPEAPVVAFTQVGIFAEMPESIKLRSNSIVGGRWALGRESGEDRPQVIKMWDRVLTQGAGRCLIHLEGYPEITFYALDLRERHGVILGLFVPTGTDLTPGSAPENPEAYSPVPRIASVQKDETGVIVKIDEPIAQILGWSAEEMEGRRTIEFLHPDDHALGIENWMHMLATPGPGRRVRLRHRTKDDSWVWFEITNHNLLADPDRGCVMSEMVDISEEMAAQEALRAREQLLDRLAETVPVGLFQIDDQRRIVYTNDRLHEILGIVSASTVAAQLATVAPADRPALNDALDAVLGDGSHTDIEVRLHLPPSGELRFCTISLRALRHEDGTISGAIACVADVTDGARMREELKQRATFDELTGCYNRPSILNALEESVDSGRRQAERAVMFVDLDSFKEVNDRHGHAAGDELLRIVAERLRGALRDGDMVGRIGGDEFLVVCPDIGGAEPAMKLAERLADTLRETVSPGMDGIGYQVSVGVVWSEGTATDADALVALADRAMYESKRERAGRPKLASTDPELSLLRASHRAAANGAPPSGD
jgi:diguanylate cyclase (GGDEF)-like protein/PAS domain S-box-containing protein